MPEPLPLPRSLPAAPVDSIYAPLCAALHKGRTAVLTAPPGAGKSSRVPLWLLSADWATGKKILLLEPRRIAARALARYMASLLGEEAGQRVGWRMRDALMVSAATRLEVVTEGVLTRLLQEDAALEDVACVIFDEFHERSLQSDLGLALCLESQVALRPDLRLLVMSATMDAAAVTAMLSRATTAPCPAIHCEGRSFPVETRWLPPPATGGEALGGLTLWRHMAAVIIKALQHAEGSVLAFLPGTGEIRLVAELLQDRLPARTHLCPLYGTLSAEEQDKAILPAPEGERKVVLATAIAETSLTIEGIRLVVDSGLSRTSRHDLGSGLDRLVTERVSLAAADQRRGRAGRIQAGICYRLWAREEEHAMRAQLRPEICEADLSSLVLQLAAWGSSAENLTWLDTPPQAALAAARRTLYALQALDSPAPEARITDTGRRMAALPLSPRLARLMLCGQAMGLTALAACLAALLEERDPLYRPAGAEAPAAATDSQLDSQLIRRLDWLCGTGPGQLPNHSRHGAEPHGLRARIRRAALRLAKRSTAAGRGQHGPAEKEFWQAALDQHTACGRLLAQAWPQWLAKRSETATAKPSAGAAASRGYSTFLLRSGKTARLPLSDVLAQADFLAIAAVDGSGPHGRIRLAAPLTAEDVFSLFDADIRTRDTATVAADGTVSARRQRTLGALILSEQSLPKPQADDCATALCAFIRQEGLRSLPWDNTSRQWLERVRLLHTLDGEVWPDVGDAALLDSLEEWLGPSLASCTALRELTASALFQALRTLLPYPLHKKLDNDAPTHWSLPSGHSATIHYGDDGGPWLEAKLQELFGCEQGPRIAGGRLGVTLRLNSPAGRPLQMTQDLGHFWRHGYAAVRAEMRGRYPKHPWPEDPLAATATALTKKKLAARKK